MENFLTRIFQTARRSDAAHTQAETLAAVDDPRNHPGTHHAEPAPVCSTSTIHAAQGRTVDPAQLLLHDQLITERNDLARQVADIWAELPPAAQEATLDRLSADTRAVLTADLGPDTSTVTDHDDDGISA
jgi:hypothetical protein